MVEVSAAIFDVVRNCGVVQILLNHDVLGAHIRHATRVGLFDVALAEKMYVAMEHS